VDFDAVPLIELGRLLKADGYDFTCPTPSTIERNNARHENAAAASLVDVFGWNRRFAANLLSPGLLSLMRNAGILETRQHLLRSSVRFSSLAGELYVHSAHPTVDQDAVFFGPDTYRFVRFARDHLIHHQRRPRRVIDVCCGSGAGGLSLKRLLPPTGQESLILSDISETALRFASVNVGIGAQTHVHLERGDLFAGLPEADLIIANPPYLVDRGRRGYRHGGGDRGIDLALRIALEGLPHLAVGGRLLLYTGSPIVAGEDCFLAKLEAMLRGQGAKYTYEEIDPDVFGEELEQPAYADVERIALVAVAIDVS
jgi:methylase of polypeptide subunit release factors